MGKMKSRRQKLHAKAVKLKPKETQSKSEDREIPIMKQDDPNPNFKAPRSVTGGDELFSKVNIDLDMLTRRLNPGGGGNMDDSRSAITSKSLRGMNLTKKDKRNLKREYWMKRIDGIQANKQALKEKKKRQKTAVVGDLRPLEDALPILDLLMRDNKHSNSPKDDKKIKKSIKKENERKKDMASDISIFTQVLQHPAFKQRPKETITEHLQNKLNYENMDT